MNNMNGYVTLLHQMEGMEALIMEVLVVKARIMEEQTKEGIQVMVVLELEVAIHQIFHAILSRMEEIQIQMGMGMELVQTQTPTLYHL